MKKFSINCDFGGQMAPFTIYIGQPEPSHHPLQFQADWLTKQRGGTIPPDVMDAIAKLKELAEKNNVSLEELCVYALGSAQEDTTTTNATQSDANTDTQANIDSPTTQPNDSNVSTNIQNEVNAIVGETSLAKNISTAEQGTSQNVENNEEPYEQQLSEENNIQNIEEEDLAKDNAAQPSDSEALEERLEEEPSPQIDNTNITEEETSTEESDQDTLNDLGNRSQEQEIKTEEEVKSTEIQESNPKATSSDNITSNNTDIQQTSSQAVQSSEDGNLIESEIKAETQNNSEEKNIENKPSPKKRGRKKKEDNG